MLPSSQLNSFVALGDSLTEGMCDTSRQSDGKFLGWADRLAMILAHANPSRTEPFLYANIAVRSRRIYHLVNDQVPHAISLKPELASIMIGSNDLVKRKADPDALAAKLERGVQKLSQSGIKVMIATNFDPQFGFLKSLRTRAAIFNSHIWSIAARHQATVLDVWGYAELKERSHWAEDRVHLSSRGHRALAYRAAELLGVSNASVLGSLDDRIHHDINEEEKLNNFEWIWQHVRPWAARRLRGKTAGDGLLPKHLRLVPIFPDSLKVAAAETKVLVPLQQQEQK